MKGTWFTKLIAISGTYIDVKRSSLTRLRPTKYKGKYIMQTTQDNSQPTWLNATNLPRYVRYMQIWGVSDKYRGEETFDEGFLC